MTVIRRRNHPTSDHQQFLILKPVDMGHSFHRLGFLVIKVMAALTILRSTAWILSYYVNYLPPNFEQGFLEGRKSIFYGVYGGMFYAHIAAGPLTLLLGLLLNCGPFVARFEHLHRILGRIQVLMIMFVVAPTGLWLAFYVEAGMMAKISFVLLALTTAGTAIMGWRSVLQRRFTEHQTWMLRCYLALCSAVISRMICGLFTAVDSLRDWLEPGTPFASWIVPLLAYELYRRYPRNEFVPARLHSPPVDYREVSQQLS